MLFIHKYAGFDVVRGYIYTALIYNFPIYRDAMPHTAHFTLTEKAMMQDNDADNNYDA